MPLDNPRIEELRRRVQADPASIAFAQLAEEYRRAGSYDEAVRACRLGLARHPGYLSARVTLGRALVELESLDDAQHELDFVLRAAPENLAAIRGMAEIHHRRGHMTEALEYYRRALSFARHDPELEETVEQISRELGGGLSGATEGLSFEEAQSELISAIEGVPGVPAPVSEEPSAAASATESVVPAEASTPGTDRSVYTAEPVGEPEAAPAAQSDPLFDFEALLGALGEEPDRAAPAPVEALLASGADEATEGTGGGLEAFQAEASTQPLPVPGESAADLAAALDRAADPEARPPEAPEDPLAGDAAVADDDSLAALEASLRAHVPTAPAPANEEAPAPALAPMQQAIVDDLERWLEELVLTRTDRPEHS